METNSTPVARDYVLIADLASDDRPREKALRHGIKSLSNAELIAIIFGNGMKGKSVLTMSRELLARHNGRLAELARMSIRDIAKNNQGIGPAKAIALAAAIELGMRCRDEVPAEKPRITGSDSAYRIIRGKLELLNHEEFWVIPLSRANLVLDTVKISSGGSAATVVDPKVLYKRILDYGEVVAALILVHNHPSGNLKPSAEDDRLTRQLKSAGELLDIRVLDHLIITSDSYYSYADEGRI